MITLAAVRITLGWLRGFLDPIIRGTGLIQLTGNIQIVAQAGALLILLGAIAVLGYVAQRSAGEVLFRTVDRVFTFGFVTADSPRAVVSAIGTPAYNVYLPNSPNPTQGRLVVVPEDRVRPVDIGVKRAIRLLVTTGITEDSEELERMHEEVLREVTEEDVDVGDAF